MAGFQSVFRREPAGVHRMQVYNSMIVPRSLLIFILLLLGQGENLTGKVNSSKTDSPVLYVDGHKVTDPEFRWFLSREKAAVFQYFNRKYQAAFDQDFWKTEFQGRIPVELAKERTLQKLIRTKVQLILFQQLGLIRSTEYSTFLEILENENRRRNDALQAGKIIYGPVQYNQRQYYDYWLSNLTIRARKILADQRFAIPEELLKSHYEAQKEKHYKKNDTIPIERITISPNRENDKPTPSHLLIREEILIRANAGQPFQLIVNDYKNRETVNVFFHKRTFTHEDYFRDSSLLEEILKTTRNLSHGQVNWFINNGSLQIIKVLERAPGGYTPFEQVKEIIRAKLIDEQYEALIQRLIKNAKIQINKSNYQEITL